MAKPTIKFNAVGFELNGKTGYRPQLEAMDGVCDLDFCEEVVKEKRLSMSAFELLHAMNAIGEVGPQKVAEDGRPRVITKLLKYNRYAQGNLESPTSPWNESCKALIRPQLMNAAEKLIDATFVNVNDGITVKLNYVTYVGAKGVQNVIQGGAAIGAYGNRMEFDAALGDTAWLAYKDTAGTERKIDLTCTTSDVAHAEFAFPAALYALEAGTALTFWMKSRGGVSGGEVHTNRKAVVYLGGVDPRPRITAVQGEGLEAGQVKVNVATHVTCSNATNITKAEITFTDPDGASDKVTLTPTGVTADGFDFKFLGGPAKEAVNNPKLVVTTPEGTAEFPVVYM